MTYNKTKNKKKKLNLPLLNLNFKNQRKEHSDSFFTRSLYCLPCCTPKDQRIQYRTGDYFSLGKGIKYFGIGKYRCTILELPLFLNKKLYNYNINKSNSIYII